jgi:hypothetical protein
MLGTAVVVRRWRSEPTGLLLLAQGLVLLVVRALPGAPPHDAERLILPSFAFLAMLAGVGCAALVGEAAGALAGWRRRLRYGALTLVYAGSFSSLLWYAPQWLSYYNVLIGGLPGATAAGLEPTYYWDALDRSTLAWLGGNTNRGQTVGFAGGPIENLDMMQTWGELPFAFSRQPSPRDAWYVVQRRPSAWQPIDRRLIVRGKPAFCKTIRDGGLGPWRLSEPILEIFSAEEVRRARAETP